MKKVRELILRFGGFFNKQRKDRDLDEEIESHLQLHTEDNIRLDMTPEEACRQAGAATALRQMLKSVFRRARIALSKSAGRMPKRPVMTRVFRVQSLSVRTTEAALRCARLQDGCVGSMAMPKRGNLASGSEVINATTSHPETPPSPEQHMADAWFPINP
ncbi:MAG: permease prefix domain 1-containing protein [Verrucomicrobiales bacterium]|nr:permease prefix domain 1-containing protein [Verrucomicrobiales bacterium]